jgi:hypothetical protein
MDDVQGHGGLFRETMPDGYAWFPDAMLRELYPGADLPCVGEEFEIVEEEA